MLGHFFQFLSLFYFGENKTLTKCYIHVDWLVGSYRCWAVLKCWPGSHPGSHNENQFTLFLNVRTGMKTDLRFSHDREPVKYIHIYFWRTGSNVYIYIFLENRTGSLIELRSGSQSSLYHLIGFLWFFFSLGTIIILLSLLLLLFFLLLLLFSHYYCSLFIGITLLFITVYFFPIPVAVTFLTWCLSFRVMKSFKY
jgi:hypothetical protein